MKEVVQDMKARYPDRYVFFDVPALLANADALALAPQVDHILMVVAAGCTSLSDVRRALELVPAEKVIGLVLNKCKDG
jgi:non-specific protein-tyrosine kinase